MPFSTYFEKEAHTIDLGNSKYGILTNLVKNLPRVETFFRLENIFYPQNFPQKGKLRFLFVCYKLGETFKLHLHSYKTFNSDNFKTLYFELHYFLKQKWLSTKGGKSVENSKISVFI